VVAVAVRASLSLEGHEASERVRLQELQAELAAELRPEREVGPRAPERAAPSEGPRTLTRRMP
jgi:hypothetical protein